MRHFAYFVCLGYFTLCHLILGYFSRVKHKQRHKQTHSNKKILQSYLKLNTLKSNTLTSSNLKSNNLTLSSLIHSKPSNLNKSKLKQYKRQCISLFICAHLVATPCAYALDNTPQPLEIAQVISSKPHTTQPNLPHSSALVEQIPTPQPPTSQIIPPQPTSLHSITPPPSTLQVATPPLAPQPDTPQSPQSITTPLEAIQHSASITPQIDLAQSPQVQQPLLASQATTLQPPPINQPSQLDSLLDSSLDSLPKPSIPSLESSLPNQLESTLLDFIALDSSPQALQDSTLLDSPAQHLQDAHLSYPSLDSSLPSKLESLDSLPITPDTSTRFLSPSITHSPNNIEIINITTPNAKGISNNHYIDFNIKPKGAILNNSLQSITSTHLAGFISSNPHLKDSTASLILNQVTSANPSYLLGMLEVAGDKASVLVANPNGIVCKSCGFSNVANLALSTALIEDKLALNEKWLNNNTINTNATNSINNINIINNKNNANNIDNTNTPNNNTANALSNANSTQSFQSLQSLQEQLKHNLSLRVQKGHINIDSLNASNTTTLTLLSKSLKINKALYANNLSILLGSNDISLSDKGALLLWQPLQIANTPNAKNTINDKTSTSPQSSTQSNTAQTSLQRNQHPNAQPSLQTNANPQNSKKSTQQSTQEIAPQPNSTNEVLALDIAYLGGVFANSIYLIASDEHSLVQNSGTMATLPSNTQGDNGFYIDINGRLSIATKTNQTTQTTQENQVNQATQATKANQANQVNQANQSTNQTKQISKALYSHNATQSHISNDSNQSNSNTITHSITHTDNTNTTNHTASIAPTTYTTLHSTQDTKNTTNTQSTISTTNTANIANTPNTPNTTPYNTTDTTPYTTTNPTDTINTTHTTSSATASLYASSTLSIFAKSITNTSSTIYAGNTLSMRVDTLENTQGSIYALNTLSIYANTINNIGVASTKTHLQSKQYLTQGNLKQVGDKHFWRSVYVDELDSFSPSIIASSGDTYILAHTLSNHNSYISASNILEIQAKNSINTQTQAYQKVIDNGVEVRNYQYTYWKNYAGVKGIVCAALTFGICNIREIRTATAQGVFTYAPPHSISKIELDFPTLESQLEPNIARLNAGIANEYAKYIHSTRLSPATNQSNAINSTNNTNYPNHSFNPNHQNNPNNANAINQLSSIDNTNSTNTINNTSNTSNIGNTNTTSYPNTTNTPNSANATNDINELANYSNASFSTSAFGSGRYDDRESFVRSSYFYHQFASRDSSQAKIFLANLDLESKAIFYNSSAFLSNALDTKILSNSQANHLKSLLLHKHYHTNQYSYNPSDDMYSHTISSVSSSVPNNVLNNTRNNTYDIYSNALNNTYNDIYGNIYNNTFNNTTNNTYNDNTLNNAFNNTLNSAHNSTNNLTHSLKYSNSISPALSPFASSIGFSGDFISLHSRTFSNDSTLQGNGISLHTSEALAHLGNIKAKDIVLQSDGTLYIGGGDIQASDKAYLQAKHISIDSLITTTKGYTPTTQTILAPARYAISTNASSSLYPFALSSSVNHTSANYYTNHTSYLNHTSHTSQINHSNYANYTNYPNYASHSNHTNYPSYPSYTNQLGTSLIPLHSIDSITATSKLKAGSLFLHGIDSASISSANLSADDSISISSSTLRLGTQALHSTYKDSYQTRKSTTHLGTTLSANSISLSAKDSLNLANASLKANESISLHSKGNISLDSTTDTHYATSTHHSTKEHFFYSKDTTTTTTTQSEVQGGSSLFSNGSLSINADKDIRAYNLIALASDDIALQSKNGDIALSSKADTYTQDITQKTVETGFKGRLSDLSISYGTDTTTLNANKNYTTYDKSLLHGNNISINAKNNVAMNSVDLRTYKKDIAVNDLDNSQADTLNTLATTNATPNVKNNTISINADSLTMDYLSNTYKDSYSSTMVSHRVGLKASVPILSPALSAAYSLDSLLNTNTSSPLHSIKAKVLQSLNATLDIADTSLDIAKAANKDFNAKLSLSYTATIASSNSESTQTNALDSAIDTANLSIHTTKDTTIKGLNANITQHTDLQAQNFTLEASKNTFTSTQSSSLDSISVGASVSVGTNGVGINAEASYDNSRSNSSISSTSYNHSTLNTNSLSLRTTENTTMRGSSIKASTLSMDIGNALDIVSLQDSTSYDSSSHSLSLSASVPVYGASAPSGQASYFHSKTNATLQSTTTLSSIQADSLSINANHTNLVGSAILGNGSLNTNTLSHSNLNNTSSYDTLSTSIGTNGGYFLSNADSSTSSALATISSGIDISSKQIATTQANPSTADNTNTSLANSISTINRNPHKNNNISLQEYTQTAIDKERENAQTISLASVLKDKANALKKDIKEMISLDDSTSQGNIANLSINAITEGIITGIVTQDFLSTVTSLANPYIANGIKHITQDNPNLSPKAQFITNVLAHSAYGALAGGLSSQSIDSLSNINNTKLLNSVLSGGISAGSAPIIARLASNAIYDTTDTSSLSAKQQEIIKSIVSVSGGIIGASISSNSANSVRYASIGTNQALNEVENNSFAKTLRTIGYPALNLSWQKGRILTLQELTTIAKNATQEVVDDIEFIISNPFSTKALNSSIGVIVGVKPSEIVNGFVDTTNYIKNILTSNDTDTLIKHTSAINSTNTKIPPISIDENANKAFITTIPKSQITQSQLTQIPSNNQQQTTITTLPRHTKDIPIIRTPSGQEVSVNIYFSNKKDDIDDIEYLAKNSKYQTTSRANEIARSFGYKDAEKLKGEFVYEKGTTSKYNVHTAGKKVILVPVRKESHLKPVDTGLRLK